eukprot:TRINITY_DN83297_c1_g1_i1.p1 TRINITY_DN83297_c1_g1~~TRINITY_DN83297_c1_g1_i1.p1  ORF type:complete len:101 (+),score=22.80 TRINITY_DN83297_c1_g1_i1:149-451(+)
MPDILNILSAAPTVAEATDAASSDTTLILGEAAAADDVGEAADKATGDTTGTATGDTIRASAEQKLCSKSARRCEQPWTHVHNRDWPIQTEVACGSTMRG